MEDQIEVLREEINELTAKEICLHSDEIVKLSQELDKLIYWYYINKTQVEDTLSIIDIKGMKVS